MKTLILILFFSNIVYAQESVVKWADYTSYATAATEPSISLINILKVSDNKKCNLLRLGLKETINNSTVLIIKHFISSPRPCIGCANDGMPSGHTANSFVGNNWKFSIVFGISTGVLRHEANKHTWKQITAGAVVGISSDLIGNLIHCGG